MTFDNTLESRMRGDYAVPTLFNGNFDSYIPNRPNNVILQRNAISKEIPGWSFHNGATSTLVSPTSDLKDWNSISTLSNQYKTGVGYNSTQPNYALELESGDTITHNRFVVPDWGVLRFNLHLPTLSNNNNGKVKVSIKGEADSAYFSLGEVQLQEANGPYTQGYNLDDTYKIGYGTQGFETFHVNLPNEYRGKTATLKFEVTGTNSPIYLDDIFFKSINLKLGNPTLNGEEARRDSNNYADNFLIERSQYTLSYNNSRRGPNWVSYQFNGAWLGNLLAPPSNTSKWQPDPLLLPPLSGVTTANYTSSDYDRGHMTTRSHRNRTEKDQWGTYFTSNALPQHPDNNSDTFRSAWRRLEGYAKDLVRQGNELYIISGGIGSLNNTLPANHPFNVNDINVPSFTWKVIVVMEPGQSISDITTNTRVIAVVTPNIAKPTDSNQWAAWRDWGNWHRSVDFIEQQTGLDLLNNIPLESQNALELNADPGPTTITTPPPPVPEGDDDDLSGWHHLE